MRMEKHKTYFFTSYAFTLIELLVVIGIIGLLAGMLFPVLRKVQMNAKKSSCLNSLHQIGIAVSSYVNDYDGHLPVCTRIPQDPEDVWSVVNIVKIDDSSIYHCPGDSDPKYSGKTYFKLYGTSYEWNTWLNGKLIDKTKLDFVGAVLDSPLLGDAMEFHGSLGRNYLYPDGNAKRSLKKLIE
jgi:prepilin-type N-terminal cleavage/methylation domain-containing protein